LISSTGRRGGAARCDNCAADDPGADRGRPRRRSHRLKTIPHETYDLRVIAEADASQAGTDSDDSGDASDVGGPSTLLGRRRQ
jgi:hypothetical protein